MKLCSDCKEKERSWSTCLTTTPCEQNWCENFKEEKKETFGLFVKEENIKMVQTEISINENNIKKNKKFDLEIKIKQYDVRILEIQKSLFNLETTRDDLKRELKSL